jgi:hypothetical protein
MISANETDWSKLTHAYGNASDIPGLIVAVERDPTPKQSYDIEPWFSLWSALCHQGSVYSASFAAVPYFLRIANSAPQPYAWDLIGLPVSIELARLRQRLEVPSSLRRDYSEALKLLPTIVCSASGCAWDHAFTQAALAALALSHGHADLAEAILELGQTTLRSFLDNYC